MLIIKKTIIFILVLASLAPASGAAVCVRALSTSAASAVLMVGGTGEVLYQKDAYKQRPMASTTKIMTAYIALRQGTPGRVITFTKEMFAEGTSMGLKAGDKITLEGLVYGMLLQSGNDAANAAAVAIGGSLDGFAQMMNDEARRLGMLSTNFVTPSGLDAEGHCTTAYDMALLAAAAADMPEFLAVCSQQSARVAFVEPQTTRRYENHNRLLYSYDGAVGMKTGFTKKSGRCLVSAAVRNGVTLVAVTLNDGDDWNDHMRMLDYGYSVIRTKALGLDRKLTLKIVGGQKSEIPVVLNPAEYIYSDGGDTAITSRIFIKHFEYAPVERGEIVGFVQFFKGDEVIASSELLADESAGAYVTEQENNSPVGYTPWFVRLWRAIRGLFGF